MGDWTAREDNDEKEGRGREVRLGREGGRQGVREGRGGKRLEGRGGLVPREQKRKEKSWKRWADGTG